MLAAFFQLFQTFFLFGNNQVDRLQICCGWRDMGSLQDFIKLFFFYLSVTVAAHRVSLFAISMKSIMVNPFFVLYNEIDRFGRYLHFSMTS